MKTIGLRILGVATVVTVMYTGLVAGTVAERSLELRNASHQGRPVKASQLSGVSYCSTDNAAPLYTAAGAIANQRYDFTPESRATALRLLHDAARMRRCVFKVDAYGYNYPDLVGCRRLVELACAEIGTRVRAGDHRGAVDLSRDTLTLVRRLCQVRTTVGHRVTSELASTLNQALRQEGLTEELRGELNTLATELEKDLAHSLDEDRVVALEMYDEMSDYWYLEGPLGYLELCQRELTVLRLISDMQNAFESNDLEAAREVAADATGSWAGNGLRTWPQQWEHTRTVVAQLRD